MAKILVTGGAGYIGSHLVSRLSLLGESVVVIDSLVGSPKNPLPKNIDFVVGDIRDQKLLRDLFSKHHFESIFHLAALINAAESITKKQDYLNTNATSSAQLFALAVNFGVRHIIFASSAAVYGNPINNLPIKESHPTHPTNPYGESKLLAERALFTTTQKTNTTFAILRFFNVAGASESGKLMQSMYSQAILTRLFAAAKEGSSINIAGHNYKTKDGTVVRDFIHVEDVVSGLISAMHYLRSNGSSITANLSTATGTTILELHDLVEKITGQKIPICYKKGVVGDIVYSLGDNSLAKNILAWQPKYNIEDIVRSGWYAYDKNT